MPSFLLGAFFWEVLGPSGFVFFALIHFVHFFSLGYLSLVFCSFGSLAVLVVGSWRR